MTASIFYSYIIAPIAEDRRKIVNRLATLQNPTCNLGLHLAGKFLLGSYTHTDIIPILPIPHHFGTQELFNTDRPSSPLVGRRTPPPQGIYWGDDSWLRLRGFLIVLWVESLKRFDASFSYLIDFESSFYDEKLKPATWAALAPHLYHPDMILQEWGLETRELGERLSGSHQTGPLVVFAHVTSWCWLTGLYTISSCLAAKRTQFAFLGIMIK